MCTAVYGRSALDARLKVLARCVEASVVSRVFSVSLGGFDLHADEKKPQENLLVEFDRALVSFVDRMARSAAGDGSSSPTTPSSAAASARTHSTAPTTVRPRVRANASDGTDHGTASSMFILGHNVHGGLRGAPPDLRDLDKGDLKYTTDFRSVYAALLQEVLDTDPGPVLAGWHGPALAPVLRAP